MHCSVVMAKSVIEAFGWDNKSYIIILIVYCSVMAKSVVEAFGLDNKLCTIVYYSKM